MTKNKHAGIVGLGSICAALIATFALFGTIRSYGERIYLIPLIKACNEKEFRDLKVLVEFNRQQALSDSIKMLQWNRAIEIVDKCGEIK
jgi:hypothetical protein